jgi:hypothetical protein
VEDLQLVIELTEIQQMQSKEYLNVINATVLVTKLNFVG